MEYLHFLLLMMSCFGSSCCGIYNNLTIPRIGLDFSSKGGDESESELSSQLQKVETRTQGWAPWSQWSACSRSCDGGISHQLRTCKGGPCRGSHVRYQICNMQVAWLLIAYLVLASAYPAKVLQGPSTKTKVIGPDGSVIDTYIPGGTVVLEGNVGPLLQSAPVVLAQAAIPEVPTAALQEPALAAATKTSDEVLNASKEINGQDLVLNRIVKSGDSVNIVKETAETSGTTESISTTEGVEYVSTGSAGVYVPDNAEQQYDDGSYRPEHY